MRITILCVGKIKEDFYRAAVAEYQKRLRRYVPIEIVEVTDERTKEQMSERERALLLAKEGERLKKYMEQADCHAALVISGDRLNSEGFADFLHDRMKESVKHLEFIIGGSVGLSEEIMNACEYRLSFSDMTFPHQLMRVILTEQIYRSFRIINNEPYHK